MSFFLWLKWKESSSSLMIMIHLFLSCCQKGWKEKMKKEEDELLNCLLFSCSNMPWLDCSESQSCQSVMLFVSTYLSISFDEEFLSCLWDSKSGIEKTRWNDIFQSISVIVSLFATLNALQRQEGWGGYSAAPGSSGMLGEHIDCRDPRLSSSAWSCISDEESQS